MQYHGRALTYLWTAPWDVVVWLVALVVAGVTRGRLAWQDGGLWAVLPAKTYPAGTTTVWAGITLGHGGILSDVGYGRRRDRTRTERHEGVHVEQYEATALAGCVLGLLVFGAVSWGPGHLALAAVLGGLVWIGAWPAVVGAGHVVALVRGEPVYLGAVHEEAAYAITDGMEGGTR